MCVTEGREHSYGVQYRRVGLYVITLKKKDKAIPLQAWTGLDVFRLMLPDFMTIGT